MNDDLKFPANKLLQEYPGGSDAALDKPDNSNYTRPESSVVFETKPRDRANSWPKQFEHFAFQRYRCLPMQPSVTSGHTHARLIFFYHM